MRSAYYITCVTTINSQNVRSLNNKLFRVNMVRDNKI